MSWLKVFLRQVFQDSLDFNDLNLYVTVMLSSWVLRLPRCGYCCVITFLWHQNVGDRARHDITHYTCCLPNKIISVGLPGAVLNVIAVVLIPEKSAAFCFWNVCLAWIALKQQKQPLKELKQSWSTVFLKS